MDKALVPYRNPQDQQRWRDNHPYHAKDANLRRNYGITLEQYNCMVVQQKGLCAICGKPPKPGGRTGYSRLNVDHDHKTGKIRGLLCGNCNRAIGMLGDDPSIVSRAAAYLRNGGDAK